MSEIQNVKTAMLFQGVTMDFRKIFAESPVVQSRVIAMQKSWQSKNLNQINVEEVCESVFYPIEEKTRYEQPAIFAVSIAKLWEMKQTCRIDLLGGHSLGEYAALYGAGVFTLDDGYLIVQYRANLIADVNLKYPSLMAAISGQFAQCDVEQICEEYGIDVAIINSSEQIVISGEREKVESACRKLEENGLKIVILETGGPFHSKLLREIQQKFRRMIAKVPFSSPKIPVIMNATAQLENNPRVIKDHLVSQLTSPVNFPEIVRTMRALGVNEETIYEIGGRNILKGFAKKILRKP